MKYITCQIPDGTCHAAILLFPDYLTHKEVARGKTVLSAGFVNLPTNTCYGSSISLGIDSSPDMDNTLLRLLLDRCNQ